MTFLDVGNLKGGDIKYHLTQFIDENNHIKHTIWHCTDTALFAPCIGNMWSFIYLNCFGQGTTNVSHMKQIRSASWVALPLKWCWNDHKRWDCYRERFKHLDFLQVLELNIARLAFAWWRLDEIYIPVAVVIQCSTIRITDSFRLKLLARQMALHHHKMSMSLTLRC